MTAAHAKLNNPRFRLQSSALAIALLMVASAPLGCAKKDGATAGQQAGKPIDTPLRGAQTPKVEVLAFLDFECPFSRRQAKELLALADKHKDAVRVRFLHLPLEVHANSVTAARGAVAAHRQDAFFKYYDKMMAAPSLGRDALIAWAVEAGLDAKRFAADLDSPETLKVVTRDVGIAKVLGVMGTPSFLVDGVLIQGVQPAEYWDKKLAEEKQKAETLLAAGTPAVNLLKVMVASANPKAVVDYEKYVLLGQTPPPADVPAKIARGSGVESAQVQPLGGGMGTIQIGEPPAAAADDGKTVWRVSVRGDDPRLGEDAALVTAVVFEDMQCPYCAKLQPTLQQLVEAYKGKLRVVFKHNPLPFHPHAMAAAEALEAARDQGKFWPMANYLLQHQQQLDAVGLADAATTIGLDKAQFQTSLAAHGAKGRIEEDMEQAAALGARGTPNLFVNGRKLVGAKEAGVLKALIDEELAKAEALVKGGTPAAQVYEAIIGKGRLDPSLDPEAKELALPKRVATRGPVGAAVHVVTFQDFQCPFSARLDPHLRALEAELPGRIKVTWVDFPMDKIHPLAQLLAEAGQEALAQGKFWEFHKALMEGGDQRDEATLRQRAKEAGLDLKKLDAALKDHRHAAAVAEHAALGKSLDVKGTPTVYLNGHLFKPQNGFSTATFRSAVTRLLGGK